VVRQQPAGVSGWRGVSGWWRDRAAGSRDGNSWHDIRSRLHYPCRRLDPLFNDKNPPIGARSWSGRGSTTNGAARAAPLASRRAPRRSASPAAAAVAPRQARVWLQPLLLPRSRPSRRGRRCSSFLPRASLVTTGTSMYGFGQCNPGLKITAVNWVGAVTAGIAVAFHDGTDTSMGQVTVAAGATSVSVPATIDGGQIASIHFVPTPRPSRPGLLHHATDAFVSIVGEEGASHRQHRQRQAAVACLRPCRTLASSRFCPRFKPVRALVRRGIGRAFVQVGLPVSRARVLALQNVAHTHTRSRSRQFR